MTLFHLVRVFTDAAGGHGNPLAVFMNGTDIAEQNRQPLSAEMGYSEVVFVDDRVGGKVRIFSPGSELSFAGHPLVGTAWLLMHEGIATSTLRPPAGDVPTWVEGADTWIRARPQWQPEWEQIQLNSVAAVDSTVCQPEEHDLTQFWAWEDEKRGVVRARVFASRVGIKEDEACGSASLLLAHRLGRPITIKHGLGSIVNARPGPDDTVELGGAVVLDGIYER